MELQVIFENNRFIAVDKPAGMLSVPGRMGESDPRPCLGRALAARLRATGAPEKNVWPVHRLDAEVSGLILFAKDAEAHRAANAWFESRRVHKFYEAWTENNAAAASVPAGEPIEWRSRLLRGKRRAYGSEHGKEAVTRAFRLGANEYRGAKIERWRLEPLTGRPHQLRYELARHGRPILGDALYGSTVSFNEGAIALRAVRLDLSLCEDAPRFGLPRELEAASLAESLESSRHG